MEMKVEYKDQTRRRKMLHLTKQEDATSEGQSKALVGNEYDGKIDGKKEIAYFEEETIRKKTCICCSKSCFVGLSIVAAAIGMIVGWVLYSYLLKEVDHLPIHVLAKNYDLFLEQQREMRGKFPSQQKHLWTTVRAAGKSVLNHTSPEQPAVILIATSTDLADCLAKEIGESLKMGFGESSEAFHMNITDLANEPANKAAPKLRRQLSHHLNHSSHVVILYRIDLLPGDSSLALRPFTDHDHAPYKNAAFIFTVEETSEVDENCGARVENVLQNAWKDGMNPDSVSSVISRIIDHSICPKEEPKLPC